MEPQQAGQQTVIVQYMNPPNFGPNPVRFLFFNEIPPKIDPSFKIGNRQENKKEKKSDTRNERKWQ